MGRAVNRPPWLLRYKPLGGMIVQVRKKHIILGIVALLLIALIVLFAVVASMSDDLYNRTPAFDDCMQQALDHSYWVQIPQEEVVQRHAVEQALAAGETAELTVQVPTNSFGTGSGSYGRGYIAGKSRCRRRICHSRRSSRCNRRKRPCSTAAAGTRLRDLCHGQFG